MTQKLKKWGNSLGLRIPKALAEQLHIDEGSEIEFSAEDGALILRPVYRLKDLVARITPENLPKGVGFGPPVGKESW